MFVSKIYNFIYVRIPKVASCSVRNAMASKHPYGQYDVKHIQTTLLSFKERHPQLFNRFKKVAFVRNPYDRMLSLYHYRTETPPHVKSTKHRGDLMGYVKSCGERFFHQNRWLCDSNKNILANHIYKFEDINTNFEEMCKYIGMPYKVLLKKNRSNRKKHYLDELTDEFIDYIRDKCADDFELFEYSIDSCGWKHKQFCPSPPISAIITLKQKRRNEINKFRRDWHKRTMKKKKIKRK